MSRTSKTLLPALLLVLSLPGLASAQSVVSLTAEEEKILAQLDPVLVSECLQIAQTVESWQREIEEVRKVLRDPKAKVEELARGAAAEATARLLRVARELGKRSEPLRRWIRYAETVEKRIKEVETAVRNVRFDPRTAAERTEKEFRARIEAEARARVAVLLLNDLQPMLDLLKIAKNPARYARDFVENEVKKKLLNESLDVGDVRVRLVPQNVTKSPFDPDANLAVVMEYKPAGVEVKATGLSFRYRKGGRPEPVLDKKKMKVQTSGLDALKQKGLKSLGDAIPDFGLPIAVKEPRFNGFEGKRPGSITFKISLGFGQFFDIKPADSLKVEGDVTVTSKGEVIVDGALKVAIGAQIPLGTTGLIFDGGSIELRPREKKEAVIITTHLAPATGGKNGISLDISIKFGVPVREISFEGALVLARTQRMGLATGKISGKEISGRLQIPDPRGGPLPIGDLLNADFSFQLDREGLSAQGTAAIFKAAKMSMDLVLDFHGNGAFKAKGAYSVCGVDAAASLSVSFEPGFRRIDMDLALSADVDLKILGRAHASVSVSASTARTGKPIHVVAEALGAKARFELSGLELLTPHLVALELLKELPDMMQNIAKAAAHWEKDKKLLLARWENHWRETVSAKAKQYGLDALRTGNEEADRFLGDIAREGKNAGRWTSDVWKKSGKEASEFIKNPADKLRDVPGNILKEGLKLPGNLGGVGDKIGGLFGGKKKKSEPSGPSAAEVKALRLSEDATNRLAPLVAAVNAGRLNLHQKPAPRMATGGTRHATELHLLCDSAVSASKGDGQASVGFVLRSSGYRSSVPVRGRAQRDAGSDVTAVAVHFERIAGEGAANPKARIELPEFRHHSDLQAYALFRDALEDLIARLLPEVDIDGRFWEKKLAIHNATTEPLRVYALLQTKAATGEGRSDWRWIPAGPTQPEKAVSLMIPPGETLLVRRSLGSAIKIPFGGRINLPELTLSGRVAHIWAESETGRIWDQGLKTPVTLVTEKDTRGNAAYHASAMATYTYTIRPVEGPRRFTERIVRVRNDTDVPLLLDARAQSRNALGKEVWSEVKSAARVDPGKTLTLHREDGWVLRGGKVQIWGQDVEGKRYRWVRHKEQVLGVVDSDGYRSDRMGSALLVFEEPGKAAPAPGSADGMAWARTLPADQVAVPAVKGLTVGGASGALGRAGLKANDGNASPRDIVLRQDPAPGVWRLPGSAVDLVAGVPVPRLLGLTLAEARKELESRGLRLLVAAGLVTNDDDRVTEQEPSPWTEAQPQFLPRGGGVKLTLTASLVEVPDLVGRNLIEATRLVKLRGLNLRTINDPEAGPVRAQRPPAGERVRRGTEIVAIFAPRTPPPPPPAPTVNVPLVIGLSGDAARTTLERTGLGFAATIRGDPVRPEMLAALTRDGFKVARQNPRPEGGPVKKGTVVVCDLDVVRPDPPPMNQLRVPPVEGKNLAEARRLLEAAGLQWKIVNSPEGNTVEKAMPPSGTPIKRGETVLLVFPPRKPDPPMVEGNLIGLWSSTLNGAMFRFKENGVFEAGLPPPGGGMPQKWEAGRYSYARGVLRLEGGGLKVEGRIQWANKEKFTFINAMGKEFVFTVARF